MDRGERGEILETELSFEYANAKHSENGKDSMSAGLNVPVSIHNTGQEPSVHICVLDADNDQRDSTDVEYHFCKIFVMMHQIEFVVTFCTGTLVHPDLHGQFGSGGGESKSIGAF